MLHTVLYAWVPSTEQEASVLERQQAANRAYAARIGAAVVAEFSDATSPSIALVAQPGLRQVLDMLQEGRANCLICYDATVIASDEAARQAFVRSVEGNGAELHYATSGKVAPSS